MSETKIYSIPCFKSNSNVCKATFIYSSMNTDHSASEIADLSKKIINAAMTPEMGKVTTHEIATFRKRPHLICFPDFTFPPQPRNPRGNGLWRWVGRPWNRLEQLRQLRIQCRIQKLDWFQSCLARWFEWLGDPASRAQYTLRWR